jgi:exodeoxyribonuclease VII large subunit
VVPAGTVVAPRSGGVTRLACDPGGVAEPTDTGAQAPVEAEAPLAPGEPDLPGPFPVGRWAAGFRGFLRGRPRVRIIGEVCNYSGLRSPAVYFELRDEQGAVPCSMWRTDLDELDLAEGALRDGVEVAAAGGPDFFPGSERSSPSFSFRVSYLRPAGEGDLLAQLERLRRQLASEGLFEPQKLLPRPPLPKSIGVVVGAGSAAQADLLAGLERRSWRGRLVVAHPPVQGRAAAPAITAALRDLAAVPEVEAIVVTRGGGSLTDLWCFCDEALCRTVAMLRVPVISAVGHEVDRTLIDDVAAAACSTPTHAAEAAVQIDVAAARAQLATATATIDRSGRRAIAERAGGLGSAARSIAGHMRAERSRVHQKIREVRAASARALGGRADVLARFGLVLGRKREATLHAASAAGGQRRRLASVAATLAAHDPDRVLERGYALVTGPGGELIASAAAARRERRLRVRFADDDVAAEVIDDE